MKFDILVMFKKGILGFVTGLAAVILLSIVQAITSYNPVACSSEVVENCTPGFLIAGYKMIIPAVTGTLVALANWLKNRGK